MFWNHKGRTGMRIPTVQCIDLNLILPFSGLHLSHEPSSPLRLLSPTRPSLVQFLQRLILPHPQLAKGSNNSQLTLQPGEGTQEGNQNISRYRISNYPHNASHVPRYVVFSVAETLLGFHRKIWFPFPHEDSSIVISFALLKSSTPPPFFCLPMFLKRLLGYIVMLSMISFVTNTSKKFIVNLVPLLEEEDVLCTYSRSNKIN